MITYVVCALYCDNSVSVSQYTDAEQAAIGYSVRAIASKTDVGDPCLTFVSLESFDNGAFQAEVHTVSPCEHRLARTG